MHTKLADALAHGRRQSKTDRDILIVSSSPLGWFVQSIWSPDKIQGDAQFLITHFRGVRPLNDQAADKLRTITHVLSLLATAA